MSWGQKCRSFGGMAQMLILNQPMWYDSILFFIKKKKKKHIKPIKQKSGLKKKTAITLDILSSTPFEMMATDINVYFIPLPN